MKKLYLFVGIMFVIVLSYYKVEAASCCTYITVNHTVTDSCCVEIHVNNPQCDGAVITLEIEGGGTWSEVYKDSTTQSPVILYCPPNGSGFVKYRVRFTQPFHPGRPYCGGDGPYQEGYTQFTDSLYLECCEDCPEGYQDWFNLESKKSNDCPDNGCEITHTFHIPDSIDCYTGYKVETDSNTTSILPFTGDSLAWIDGCISAGTTFHAKVILYTANGDSCIIEDSVFCDEPRDTNDLQEPCVPDCFETPFSVPYTSSFTLGMTLNGLCKIKVTFVYREACGFQDIQIIKIEVSEGCIGIADSTLYREALLYIIDQNPMHFDPEYSGCSTIWRVVQGGCWSEWEYYYNNWIEQRTEIYRVLEPCTNTACCVQGLRVCKDPGPPKTISIMPELTLNPPDINCDSTWLEDPNTHWIEECFPKCSWVTNWEGIFTPPEAIAGKISKYDEQQFDSRIGIKLFQEEEYIQVQLKNEGVHNIEIKILDLQGKERVYLSQAIKDGENIIRISKNGLNRGVYIMTIVADGHIIKSDKLLIK